MSRLSLDAFKAQVNSNQIEELENLTGGIMAACHTCTSCGGVDDHGPNECGLY